MCPKYCIWCYIYASNQLPDADQTTEHEGQLALNPLGAWCIAKSKRLNSNWPSVVLLSFSLPLRLEGTWCIAKTYAEFE